jgi:hypothetical protein
LIGLQFGAFEFRIAQPIRRNGVTARPKNQGQTDRVLHCQTSVTYALWVYASVRNSRLLQSTSLYEVTLETHCVIVAEGFVFVTDSRGNFPDSYLEENTTILSAGELGRFLDKRFRPTHVSVDSSIPYDTVLRGADLRGHNLLNVAASLTDRVQICRSAKGSSKDSGRRYVGMNKGRVRQELSEEGRRTFELKTFVQWAEDVAKVLKSKASGSALFDRYMPTCAPPANPVPKTLCLDLLRHDLSLTLADGSELRGLIRVAELAGKHLGIRRAHLERQQSAGVAQHGTPDGGGELVPRDVDGTGGLSAGGGTVR